MPPKKKEVVVEKPIIGRFKSNLKVRSADRRRGRGGRAASACVAVRAIVATRQRRGARRRPRLAAPDPTRARAPTRSTRSQFRQVGIVGLPNVGKSTLFNVLTRMGIPAENFPFCTIEPNAARVNVPDDRFRWLCDLYAPKSQVPAFLEIVDIAGLVKGAANGEGLGNAFLSHIAAVDGVFHVARAFEDVDVTHVEDRVDPVEDLEIIHG